MGSHGVKISPACCPSGIVPCPVQIKEVVRQLPDPPQRQTLFFSATWPKEVHGRTGRMGAWVHRVHERMGCMGAWNACYA